MVPGSQTNLSEKAAANGPRNGKARGSNVLILSLVFPPDGVSTAQIMAELAVDLEKAGHRVSVVTTQPHYNTDESAAATQPLVPAWGGLIFRSSYRGIPVVHVRMGPRGSGTASRLAGWLRFHVVGFFAALRLAAKPEVIIVPSPLLSLGAVAWAIGLVTGARYVYNVQELYPDLAVQLGKLKSPVLIGMVRALERFVYRTAAAITVITPRMQSKLLARGVPDAKLRYIPNFVDVDDLVPLDKSNAFSREHELADRFVVGYAGNMGHAQGLDVLLEAAAKLRDEPRIVFLFVGGGVGKDRLAAAAREMKLGNVLFLPHQPYARVPEIYASCDLAVVPLLASIEADAVPSKVYRIMACERPVLAIASKQSDLASIVDEARAGLVVPPAPDEIAAAVREYSALGRERRERDGRSGREYVLATVARPRITSQYDSLVAALAR